MAELYELLCKAVRKGFSEEAIGLNVIDSVLSNRNERDDIYRRGESKNFRNKEISRVLKGLENIVADQEEPLRDSIRKDPNLSEYRSVYRLNYIYDVLKCSFQYTRDIRKSAEFIGHTIIKKAQQHQQLPDYEKKNITESHVYHELLKNFKNSIRKKYHIIIS